MDHEQVRGFVIGARDQLKRSLDQLVSSGSEGGEPLAIIVFTISSPTTFWKQIVD